MEPTVIWEDNAACISMSKNPVNPEAAKHWHIDIACHKLRELYQNKVIILQKIPTQEDLADALTKSLPASMQYVPELEDGISTVIRKVQMV